MILFHYGFPIVASVVTIFLAKFNQEEDNAL